MTNSTFYEVVPFTCIMASDGRMAGFLFCIPTIISLVISTTSLFGRKSNFIAAF